MEKVRDNQKLDSVRYRKLPCVLNLREVFVVSPTRVLIIDPTCDLSIQIPLYTCLYNLADVLVWTSQPTENSGVLCHTLDQRLGNLLVF